MTFPEGSPEVSRLNDLQSSQQVVAVVTVITLIVGSVLTFIFSAKGMISEARSIAVSFGGGSVAGIFLCLLVYYEKDKYESSLWEKYQSGGQ